MASNSVPATTAAESVPPGEQPSTSQQQPAQEGKGSVPAPATASSTSVCDAAGDAAGKGASRRVSTSDIQMVQNLIEKCLQLYLSQREVVHQLSQQAKVEPGFTQLVWQKLEEQNPDFFRAYYTRLKLKDQIILFNHLLDQQVQMFHKIPRNWMQMPGSLPNKGLQEEAVETTDPFGESSAQPGAGQPGQGGVAAPVQELGAFGSDSGLELGLDTGGHPVADDLPQSLPFSASDVNLSALGHASSPARGSFGGNDNLDLQGIPRNFSLSDLGLDGEHVHKLSRDFSMSDLAKLEEAE